MHSEATAQVLVYWQIAGDPKATLNYRGKDWTMDINITLIGQVVFVHLLAASALTFIYGRRFSPSAGGSILAIFAWLIPILGPACFAIFLIARRESSRDTPAGFESQS